mgnify:CR=1 FL=1
MHGGAFSDFLVFKYSGKANQKVCSEFLQTSLECHAPAHPAISGRLMIYHGGGSKLPKPVATNELTYAGI